MNRTKTRLTDAGTKKSNTERKRKIHLPLRIMCAHIENEERRTRTKETHRRRDKPIYQILKKNRENVINERDNKLYTLQLFYRKRKKKGQREIEGKKERKKGGKRGIKNEEETRRRIKEKEKGIKDETENVEEE